jgi:hypothetical protein
MPAVQVTPARRESGALSSSTGDSRPPPISSAASTRRARLGRAQLDKHTARTLRASRQTNEKSLAVRIAGRLGFQQERPDAVFFQQPSDRVGRSVPAEGLGGKVLQPGRPLPRAGLLGDDPCEFKLHGRAICLTDASDYRLDVVAVAGVAAVQCTASSSGWGIVAGDATKSSSRSTSTVSRQAVTG